MILVIARHPVTSVGPVVVKEKKFQVFDYTGSLLGTYALDSEFWATNEFTEEDMDQIKKMELKRSPFRSTVWVIERGTYYSRKRHQTIMRVA